MTATTDTIAWGALAPPDAADTASTTVTPPSGDGAPPLGGVDHLSASSISQYLRCPRQWAIVRLLGVKIPPDGGLRTGLAVHAGAEHGMLHKLDRGEDAPADEVCDVARDRALAENARAEQEIEETGLREHIQADGMRDDTIIDKATRLAGVWAKDASPLVQPAEVETSFTEVLAGVEVTGRLDVVDSDHRPVDWKTAGKTPSADDLAKRVQSEIYEAATEKPVRYIHLVDLKGGVKVVDTPLEPNPWAPRLAADTVEHVAAGIAGGAFPRNRDGWHCTQKWCGLYSRCLAGRYDEQIAEIGRERRAVMEAQS